MQSIEILCGVLARDISQREAAARVELREARQVIWVAVAVRCVLFVLKGVERGVGERVRAILVRACVYVVSACCDHELFHSQILSSMATHRSWGVLCLDSCR